MTTQNKSNITQINPLETLKKRLEKTGINQHHAVELIIHTLQYKIKDIFPKVYHKKSWWFLTEQLEQAEILTGKMGGQTIRPCKFSEERVKEIFHLFWTTTSTIGTRGKNNWYDKNVWKQVRDQINQMGMLSV